MPGPNFLTIAEQAAHYLLGELQKGRWRETMPGVHELSPILGVNSKTVEAALKLLEQQQVLEPQGQGRRRRIIRQSNGAPPALKVVILPYEPAVTQINYILDIRHNLQQAGHHVDFAEKDLQQLRMDPQRVAKMVAKSDADAWVVVAGSREVMEWFEASGLPTFALFGRARDLSLPYFATQKVPAMIQSVERLIALGHRRIVLLTREERRKPFPGMLERSYLEVLKSHKLEVGSFNLPNWEDNRESFHRCLVELFRHTPPTALFISEASLFVATQQFLAQRGLVVPRDVSMICLDSDPVFSWCQPRISHIRWNPKLVTSRIVRWANNVARGKNDRRKTNATAEFIEGGTIGPAAGTTAGI